jgi:hypothetical protein
MGIQRTPRGLELQVEAASQRQAYNNFRKVRVLFQRIVDRTPVLSGSLRASWYASYGAPEYRFVDVAGNKHKIGVAISPAVFPLEYDRNQAWNIVITNGAPYANRMEHGDSNQAPVGMVRISVLEVFGFGIR